MKIVDRLKRWTGVEHFQDTALLNRYGASSIDELYVMILMDRTAEATDHIPMGIWRIAILLKLREKFFVYKKHHFRPRRIEEAAARERHKDAVRSYGHNQHYRHAVSNKLTKS